MKRLLLPIFLLCSFTFLCNEIQEQANDPLSMQQEKKQPARVTLSSGPQPFILTDNPHYQAKQQQKIPLPIDQIPRDLLYTLDELQADNSRDFQKEVRRWIKWLNPIVYIPEAQKKCETHIDFLFFVLLADHIEDVQSRPNISPEDAQAIESTFHELYSITIPVVEGEEFLLEVHRPFKYPLYALLFSLMESKTLSLQAYPPCLREKRALFFNSMFTQVVSKMHRYCHHLDIELDNEVEDTIQGNLEFILPTALKAIKRNHCNAYQGGDSWWSYLYDSFSAISPYLNKTITGLILVGVCYLILQEDRHTQQIIQNLGANQNQPAVIAAIAATQTNSLKIFATIIPAALPYLLSDSEVGPPLRPSTYGYRNTSNNRQAKVQRGWLS